MGKMITYWKSNAKTELGFYGIDQNKKIRIDKAEINIHIAEIFAETDDEDEDNGGDTSNEISVPPDNCIVLIENIWIEKFVDLSNDLITKEIGDIPIDVMDDDDIDDINDDYERVPDNTDKGETDYNIDNLLNEFIRVDEIINEAPAGE
jgi:FMN-dependent NADH-azoreductase